MKVYRIYAGLIGQEKQIMEFLLTENGNIWCDITELDKHGAPAFEQRIPLVLGEHQMVIVVPRHAEIIE